MPTIIKNVESIPLNKNGKTDYKKLYEIVLENEKIDITAPLILILFFRKIRWRTGMF